MGTITDLEDNIKKGGSKNTKSKKIQAIDAELEALDQAEGAISEDMGKKIKAPEPSVAPEPAPEPSKAPEPPESNEPPDESGQEVEAGAESGHPTETPEQPSAVRPRA